MFDFGKVRTLLAIVALAFAMFPPAGDAADNLGVRGEHPRWRVLVHYQETIRHNDFTR